MKINKKERERMFNIYLFSLLITINIYFGIFVWVPSDLSPNIALFIVTIFPIILLARKIFKGIKKKK